MQDEGPEHRVPGQVLNAAVEKSKEPNDEKDNQILDHFAANSILSDRNCARPRNALVLLHAVPNGIGYTEEDKQVVNPSHYDKHVKRCEAQGSSATLNPAPQGGKP